MKKTLLALIIAVGVSIVAYAQKTSVLTADNASDNGLVYYLPVTSIDVRVTARCTERVPGPYYRYAKRYIGNDNVITEQDVNWEITDISITSHGEADPSMPYIMQLKPGALTRLYVAQDGMLLSINTEVAEETGNSADMYEENVPKEKITGKEYLQYVTGDFMASQSSAKQAQLLAESIMEVREARLSLTRGTADNMPSDGRQLEIMLQSLQDQEKAMMRAFTGYEITSSQTRTFSFTPSEGASSRKVLFRLSRAIGFVDASDLSGEPIYINLSDIQYGEIPEDDGKPRKMPKDGVAYMIPGSAQVNIGYKDDNLLSRRMDFAQYGEVFTVAHNLFTDKKAPQYAIFDPSTGAIKQMGNAVTSE